MFIDTHAHLTDRQFSDDVDIVIENAFQSGIRKIITSGYDLKSSQDAILLAQQYEGLFVSVGVYPENIYEYNEEVENEIIKLAQNSKVVAIGEIGLQYTANMPSKEKQKEVFLKQLKLAYELKKPVVIHCRDAYMDMLNLLKDNKNLISNGGTFHCFSGSIEIAKEILELGFHVSVGGVSTFKNAVSVKEMVKFLPIDRIVLETDCPYLTPTPFRGKRNEPKYILSIAENLAQIKNINIEDVGKKTSENARRLFNL